MVGWEGGGIRFIISFFTGIDLYGDRALICLKGMRGYLTLKLNNRNGAGKETLG